jgi:F0F1-type ATP synthase assembly protein I
MSPEPTSKDSGQKRAGSQAFGQMYRDIAPYLTLGMQLAAAVIFFFLIGWWLDTHYETSPTFKLIGLVIGSVGGMIKFLKSAVELGKKEKSP